MNADDMKERNKRFLRVSCFSVLVSKLPLSPHESVDHEPWSNSFMPTYSHGLGMRARPVVNRSPSLMKGRRLIRRSQPSIEIPAGEAPMLHHYCTDGILITGHPISYGYSWSCVQKHPIGRKDPRPSSPEIPTCSL